MSKSAVRRLGSKKLLAIVFLGSAILLPLYYRHWLATRTFIATSMPISLSRGHIDTGEFEINLRETYFVRLDFDRQLESEECDPRGKGSPLQTFSTVFRDGKAVSQVKGQFEQYLGGFFDSIAYFDVDQPGRYRLDIQIVSEASCLDRYGPRISVVAVSDFYYELHTVELVLSGAVAMTAFGLWNSSAVAQTARRIVCGERIGLFGQECPYLRRPRFPAVKRFCTFPSFGLVFTLTIALLLIIVQIPATISNRSKGLWVSVVPPRHAVPILPDPVLVLDMESSASNPKIELILNSKHVQLSELSAALRTEFSRRPDWIVYLNGDSEISWSDVAQVIDVVEGEHGKVILQKKRSNRSLEATSAAQHKHLRAETLRGRPLVSKY